MIENTQISDELLQLVEINPYVEKYLEENDID